MVQTLAISGTLNVNVLESTNRPAGAVGIGILLPGGGYAQLFGIANLPRLGGSATTIATGINLAAARALLTNQFPAAKVVANVLYAIEDGGWNGGTGGTVSVHGIGPDEYAPVGYVDISGVNTFVSVDVVAGTYAPYAGAGPSGTARDPFAVGDVKTITDAVTDAGNTWTDGDLTAYGSSALQDAGAPAAQPGQHGSILVGTADVVTLDEFDYPDVGGGGAWRYRYGRRNNGTSGWTRTPKG